MRPSGSYRRNLQVQAALTAVTDAKKESVWFIIVYCFFTAGSAKFLQLSFVIFFGEELTVFWFVKGECEKNLRTTGLGNCLSITEPVEANKLWVLSSTSPKSFWLTNSPRYRFLRV